MYELPPDEAPFDLEAYISGQLPLDAIAVPYVAHAITAIQNYTVFLEFSPELHSTLFAYFGAFSQAAALELHGKYNRIVRVYGGEDMAIQTVLDRMNSPDQDPDSLHWDPVQLVLELTESADVPHTAVATALTRAHKMIVEMQRYGVMTHQQLRARKKKGRR